MPDADALYALRLRTPRLELRLPRDEERGELREVAVAGIHPPEEMPFAVAWTDDPDTPGFVVDHLREQHESWSPEEWHLLLGVWVEGELAGIQELTGRDFAETRTVGTGSWLGQRFQRRGYGTEMRAAVLELAFRGLGAEAALSGWIEGNNASRRVSEKLGYHVMSWSTVAPRGADVPHANVRLERAAWRSPVPVEIDGLEPCLPLFGADAR